MEQPAADASAPADGYEALEAQVLRLRSAWRSWDAQVDVYGDHLDRATERADRALAVVARRCGAQTSA